MTKAVQGSGLSLVVVDDPAFSAKPAKVPQLVIDGASASPGAELVVAGGADSGPVVAEIRRRLVKAGSSGRFLRIGKPTPGSFDQVTVRDENGRHQS